MKKQFIPFFMILTGFLLLQVAAVWADDQSGGGEITFESPAKGVHFSHEVHVEMGFDCDSCHDGLFEMETGAAAATDQFTMDAMDDGQYCGACHDGSMAFSLQSTCSACHEDGGNVHFTAPVQSVRFGHKEHVEMGFECGDCHGGMFEMKALEAQKGEDFTMEALYNGEYCGACHDGSTAFASNTRCATCHVGVKGYERTEKSDGKKVANHP